MEKGFVLREGEGGFERAIGILEMINKFPDLLSDDDVEGAADFVYPDLRNTVLGLLELESARGPGGPLLPAGAAHLPGGAAGPGGGEETDLHPLHLPAGDLLGLRQHLPPVHRDRGGGHRQHLRGAGGAVLGLRHGAGTARLPLLRQHHRHDVPHPGAGHQARRHRLQHPRQLQPQRQDPRLRRRLPGHPPVHPGEAGGRDGAGPRVPFRGLQAAHRRAGGVERAGTAGGAAARGAGAARTRRPTSTRNTGS